MLHNDGIATKCDLTHENQLKIADIFIQVTIIKKKKRNYNNN